ncbi:hypothetical protein JCM10450v2_005417 [Rhodotorula kratochvilovae]
MSLWAPPPAMQPAPETQYSLPLPPHLAAPFPPSSLPPPLPVPTLPPPPPATSLDAARLRLALDRVKLELDGAREALAEVLALKDAVDALREEVRLIREERDAGECDLEARIVATVRAALEEQLAPLRAAVTIATDKILSGLRETDGRVAAEEARAASAQEQAGKKAEQVERALRVEMVQMGQRAGALVEQRVQALRGSIDEGASGRERREGTLRRLEGGLAKVEARLEALIQETAKPRSLANGCNHVGESGGGSSTVLAAQYPSDPSPLGSPVVQPQLVTDTTRAAQPAVPASSSSDAPGPSPPPHRARRFVDDAAATTPRQTISLPHAASFAPVAAASSAVQRASTAPTAAGAGSALSPTLVHALARSSTKRRVIEQDESLPEAGKDDAGEGVKRRRVIEQDATPASTQEEGEQGKAGVQQEGLVGAEQQQEHASVDGEEMRGVDGVEEEDGEPDTLE